MQYTSPVGVKTVLKVCKKIYSKNADDRTRTCNLRFRRPMLYPVELHPLASLIKDAKGTTSAFLVLGTALCTSMTLVRVDRLNNCAIMPRSPSVWGMYLYLEFKRASINICKENCPTKCKTPRHESLAKATHQGSIQGILGCDCCKRCKNCRD